MGRLNAMFVHKAAKPGLFSDGDGLYLQVTKTGSKSWIFRYMLNRKARTMGLGPANLVTLAEARLKSFEHRKQLLDGVDPLAERNLSKQKLELETVKTMSFDQCADAYIAAHRKSWKNAKHASQWENTIKTYASPTFGSLPIQQIDTSLVIKVIEPIWFSRTETASRLRNRIELIISWATVRGYRFGENPARWKSHLDQLLPKRSAVQQVKHFAALPIDEIRGFMKKLRELKGIAPLALEFQILCASRTGETLGAKWSEINLTEKNWTIPASRMKAKKEHRVPLNARAIEILSSLYLTSDDDYIFPGRSKNKSLSNNTFLSILKRQIGLKITAHGFRSTFRDWAGERTNFSREVVEKALAHSLKDATEAAYQRGDLLMRRRILMNEWAKFCSIEATMAVILEMPSGERALYSI